MQKSPIKFDDLAFILLFFFMVVAVVSFGQAAQKVQTQSAGMNEQKIETLSVFLNTDGSLVYDGKTVEPSFFDDSSAVVELSCSPEASWNLIQRIVNSFKCEVVLVV